MKIVPLPGSRLFSGASQQRTTVVVYAQSEVTLCVVVFLTTSRAAVAVTHHSLRRPSWWNVFLPPPGNEITVTVCWSWPAATGTCGGGVWSALAAAGATAA